jgi:uncharacterized membrane protein
MTGSLAHLVLAALVFVGGHFVLSSMPVRSALIGAIGEQPFRGLYSLLAIGSIVWMVAAYNAAPITVLWPTDFWMVWVPVIVMPFALLLFVGGLTQYNPTLVVTQTEPTRADPAPGILKITRHPMMWSFGLWALAHLFPNGDLPSLIFFGSLAVLALGGTIHIDARRRAREGESYRRLEAASSSLPLLAVIQGRAKLTLADIGLWRIAVAVVLWAALFHLHRFIAGVPVPL